MKNLFSQKNVRLGLTSVAISALLLAVLVAVTSLVGLLPKSKTILDASENGMYSVSDAAKRDIAKVKSNVSVYLLTAGGEKSLSETGTHLYTFLKRASAQNKKISYKIIDLYTDTDFISQKGIDTSNVTVPSFLVESELRSRYVDSSDIFYYYIEGVGKTTQSEAQMYQYYAAMYGSVIEVSYRFEGEGLLVSALSYVTSPTVPTICALTSHGETSLPTAVKNQISALGASYNEISSLTSVPLCDVLLINAPTSDLTYGEFSIIKQYLQKGGKLFLTTAPGVSALTNISALAEIYGLSPIDDVIIDPTEGYFYNYPNWLTPMITAHTATAGLSYKPLIPTAHAIATFDTAGVTSMPILSTSASSYVIPTTSSSAEKPEGTEQKSYAAGIVAEATNGSTVLWLASSAVFDETANQYSGGGNFEFAASVVSYLCGIERTANSEFKALTLVSEQLTFSGASRLIVSAILVAVIPLSVMIAGIVYCYKRKRR